METIMKKICFDFWIDDNTFYMIYAEASDLESFNDLKVNWPKTYKIDKKFYKDIENYAKKELKAS